MALKIETFVMADDPSAYSLRRIPVGAEVQPQGGVHFRVWAPRSGKVEVVLEGGPGAKTRVKLSAEENGYFSCWIPGASAGTLYRFCLDTAEGLFPDPASRFQPEGIRGPSQVVDPGDFEWHDQDWPGIGLGGQVLYEMHVGTFTPDGTWSAAANELQELKALGITALEVMPVHQFQGRFGWGYDPVQLFAPMCQYGSPDDFRRFVDRAHGLGLGVILDVVYNHLGPQAGYHKDFSRSYFTDGYTTEWGEAINFNGPDSLPVREFVIANAGYWVEEFHIDGLRVDATTNIYDNSEDHILAAIARRVRAAGRGKKTFLAAENEAQNTKLVRSPEEGGYGFDAVWSDDFHHTVKVTLTGRRDAYFTDYLGTPQELISAVKRGYLYQGQYYRWQNKRRGTPTFGLHPATFIHFLQNHDQIANSRRGERVHLLTSPARYRAMTALLLLAPETPMLFQGQEFAASSPFLFFSDHEPEIGRLTRQGRMEFLAQFPGLAPAARDFRLPDPCAEETFRACKLDFSERERHAEVYALHKDLLKLRHGDPVFREQRPGSVDGAVLSRDAFMLRFFGAAGEDRLLLVNLGGDLHLDPAPEPLLAPPAKMRWSTLWSSEDFRYGGSGVLPSDDEQNWRIPGQGTFVMKTEKVES